MLFAGLAASAAVDLLSLLQPEKPKGGTGAKAQASFSVEDAGAIEAAASQPPPPAAGRSESLSRDALDTLLSAQGQTEAARRKKHATSVLLELLQSSQNGKVGKADFEAAVERGEGQAAGHASDDFDRIDLNRDSSVNLAELSAYFETYRRNAEAATQVRLRALAEA